jgi:hypothetical protein
LVELGIFDQSQWRAYGLLHSPAFERSADAYTRRCRRSMDNARTRSEHVPDTVRTPS